MKEKSLITHCTKSNSSSIRARREGRCYLRFHLQKLGQYFFFTNNHLCHVAYYVWWQHYTTRRATRAISLIENFIEMHSVEQALFAPFLLHASVTKDSWLAYTVKKQIQCWVCSMKIIGKSKCTEIFQLWRWTVELFVTFGMCYK